MVKLAGLVEAFARALQVNPSRVRTAAAHLRKHRLVSTGPRGPGAPDMKPADATNLLLAIMYDGELADAEKTVCRLRQARIVRCQGRSVEESSDESFPRNGFLRAADGQHAELGEALDTMFDTWVRCGALSEDTDGGDELDPVNMDLEVACPGYRASLRFNYPAGPRWHLEYEWKSPEQLAYEAENGGMFAVRWDARNGPHIWSSRSVNEDCLTQIADCLRGAERDGCSTDFVPSHQKPVNEPEGAQA